MTDENLILRLCTVVFFDTDELLIYIREGRDGELLIDYVKRNKNILLKRLPELSYFATDDIC